MRLDVRKGLPIDRDEVVRGNEERQWLFPQDLGKPIRLLVIGTWRDGRVGGRGGPYLQQLLQAATESVQFSTGVCHRLLPTPIALEDGRDDSCGEDGGHQTSDGEGSEGKALKTPHLSPNSAPETLSAHTHPSGHWSS